MGGPTARELTSSRFPQNVVPFDHKGISGAASQERALIVEAFAGLEQKDLSHSQTHESYAGAAKGRPAR